MYVWRHINITLKYDCRYQLKEPPPLSGFVKKISCRRDLLQLGRENMAEVGHHNKENHFCIDPPFDHRRGGGWNWRGPRQTVAMKLEVHHSDINARCGSLISLLFWYIGCVIKNQQTRAFSQTYFLRWNDLLQLATRGRLRWFGLPLYIQLSLQSQQSFISQHLLHTWAEYMQLKYGGIILEETPSNKITPNYCQ